MSNTMCPGQDTRFWQPGDIFEVKCGACGTELEFFKDEGQRRCTKCGTRVRNPKLALGCAQWCEHAKECLGFDPKEMQLDDEGEHASLADRLVEHMKMEFGKDQKRITHALRVLEESQKILRSEKANPRVVVAAALLHDIGIQEAERKHGSNVGKYQEIEGPPIAERIMKEIKLDSETIDDVCRIIGCHHSVKGEDSTEFRIVWDADHIVNIIEEEGNRNPDNIKDVIENVFKTEGGKARAGEVFLNAGKGE